MSANAGHNPAVARPADLAQRYGPWALVAGASEGLGEAFASQLAAAGLNLVLVARRPGPLAAAAERLRAAHGVEVRTMTQDLGMPGAAAAILRSVADIEVGALVYNAALSVSGDFLDVALDTHRAALQVNCLTPQALVHGLGGAMRRRGRGAIVLVSSLSGTVGGACLATYGGTKAFLNVFGEALWDELRDHGVDVVVSVAGATLTPGYERRRPTKLPALSPKPMPADAVARDALACLGQGPRTIPGRGNRVAAFFLRHFMTRRRAVQTMGAAGREVHAATVARHAADTDHEGPP